MSELIERAHETIHEHGGGDRWARGVAVLVSALAAALALTEIGGKASQTAYLTHHVTWTNDWAFYQAKNLRAVVRTSAADLMASLPNAEDPKIQARIKESQDTAARMRDDPESGEGMKQLAAKARSSKRPGTLRQSATISTSMRSAACSLRSCSPRSRW